MDGQQITLGYGLCACGCGERTRLAAATDPRWGGRIKGQPLQWVTGHHRRFVGPDYVAEDRGYETPCWIWQRRSIANGGYGAINVNGKMQNAHRAFYERRYGPVSKRLTVDHLCRVRLCVNPDHMEPVTTAVNVQRGARAKLSMDIARTIRARVAAGESQSAMALEYGVTSGRICDLVHGRCWRES